MNKLCRTLIACGPVMRNKAAVLFTSHYTFNICINLISQSNIFHAYSFLWTSFCDNIR